MSIFGNILNTIFSHASAQASSPSWSQGQAAAGAGQSPQSTAAPASAPAAAASASATVEPASLAPQVDVGAVLEAMAAASPGHGGNYKTSIVDLLSLLGLDSSLSARKELANELDVHAGADGSAEQNIALHRAVMDKLAANGGVVPDSMRH